MLRKTSPKGLFDRPKSSFGEHKFLCDTIARVGLQNTTNMHDDRLLFSLKCNDCSPKKSFEKAEQALLKVTSAAKCLFRRLKVENGITRGFQNLRLTFDILTGYE